MKIPAVSKSEKRGYWSKVPMSMDGRSQLKPYRSRVCVRNAGQMWGMADELDLCLFCACEDRMSLCDGVLGCECSGHSWRARV